MTRTIPTTLGALTQAETALQGICALKLDATSAYHVKKLAQLVAIETKHFQAERESAIKELGTARPDGGVEITPDNPQLPEFMRRMTELAAVAVEVAWSPITLAMLGSNPVSANELAALGPLIAEPEDAEATS